MANHKHESKEQSGFNPNGVIVVMVPFLSQSHLHQLLQLASLFVPYNIPVHYVSSSVHNRQVRLRKHVIDPADADIINKIQFHDILIPSLQSPPPNPSYKFPVHIQSSFDAALQLGEPVGALLRELSRTARRVIIIRDFMMASVVQDAASISNAEIYGFNPLSVFAVFLNEWKSKGKPIQLETEASELPYSAGNIPDEVMKFVIYQKEYTKHKAGILHNTCRLIEGTYIELLGQLNDQEEQWAIGPLNVVPTFPSQKSSNRQHKCFEWLDKQTPNSVLYVSFGTTTTLSNEQINEIAKGLEQSETKFIWVLREADRSNIFGEVEKVQPPEGFEEKMEGIGIIVRDWVPQVEILRHPSIGGFMSHCGWNSCLESISIGVPLAAWPMHSDQPQNAILLTEVLKIGIIVDKWPHIKELVTSSPISEAVRRLMALEEGEILRRRSKELGRAVQQHIEDGLARKELESFIAHITR